VDVVELSPLLQRVDEEDPYLDVVQESADEVGAINIDDANPRLRAKDIDMNFFIVEDTKDSFDPIVV
jgi:hypothetical protein